MLNKQMNNTFFVIYLSRFLVKILLCLLVGIGVSFLVHPKIRLQCLDIYYD